MANKLHYFFFGGGGGCFPWRGGLLPRPFPDLFPVFAGAFGGDARFAMVSRYVLMNYLGEFHLCRFAGTGLGPGFG